MNEQPRGATRASDVALPIRFITLAKLKTRDGQPVVVGCESVDELVLGRILKKWPGDRPASAMAPKLNPEDVITKTDAIAPMLIEAATFLEGPDGTQIRPAFWFTTEVPGAIAGRLLREEDKILLVRGVLEAGDYVGGEASAASFPRGVGVGRADGAGAVDAGEGERADAVAGAPGPTPGVQPDGDAGSGEGGAGRE